MDGIMLPVVLLTVLAMALCVLVVHYFTREIVNPPRTIQQRMRDAGVEDGKEDTLEGRWLLARDRHKGEF